MVYKHVCTVSDLRLNSPDHEVTLQSQRRIIRRSSQSAGFLLARMSDVTHHPMSHITSAHNIPTSNTILRRNIKSPPIYNTKPIFATHAIWYLFYFNYATKTTSLACLHETWFNIVINFIINFLVSLWTITWSSYSARRILIPQRAHLSHVVYIHIIKCKSVQYKQLLYSGPTTLAPEYQYLLHINHIKSCPTSWHHTFIYLTSPFSYDLYSETSHQPFSARRKISSNKITKQLIIMFYANMPMILGLCYMI